MLRIEKMLKQYPGFRLDIPFLEVQPGEILGLLGHNGAGKSTLLKAAVGVIATDLNSRVYIGGKVIDHKDLNRYVSLITEEHPMYGWMKVDEHYRFLSRFYSNWDWEANQRLCERLRVPRSKKIMELSKGTRLKTTIISALSHHPKVLLLDEPTSGLDLESRTEILDQLYEAKISGTAVIFSSHIMDDIQSVATTVAILANGQIRFVSPLNNIHSGWIAHVMRSKPSDSAEKVIRSDDGSWVSVHKIENNCDHLPDQASLICVRSPTLKEVFLTVGGQ